MSGPIYIFFNVILIYFHQTLNFLSSPLPVHRPFVYRVDTSTAISPHTAAHLNHTSIPGSTSWPCPVNVTITPTAHHPHIFNHPDLYTTTCFTKAAILELINPDSEGTLILQNVRNSSPIDTRSRTRRLLSSM